MSGFDAAAWLERFKAVGGWCTLSKGKLWIGWQVEGQELEACALYRELQRVPMGTAALKAIIEPAG